MMTSKFALIGAMLFLLLGMVAGPASAQFADPLTLASSGIVIPFFGSGNNVSILEVSSPAVASPNLHMIFYSATCTRVVSFPAAQTVNDVDLFVVGGAAGGITTGIDGLAAIAGESLSRTDLVPLSSTIHARVYWLNVQSDRFRILEPILVDTADRVGLTNWVPLRSGATFFAPIDSPGALQTTLYLICPKDTIQGAPGSAFPTSSFPAPSATASPTFKSSYGQGSLRARVYDDDELFLRNVQFDCDCLQTKPVTALSDVYTTSDTYTEIETDGSFAGFTGYKALTFAPAPSVDFFGRLSNSNRFYLQGDLTAVGAR